MAIEYIQQALAILANLDILPPSAGFYIPAGAVAAAGRPLTAAQLIGAADALLANAGIDLQPPDRLDSMAIKAAVRESLEEDVYQAA